jgi:3-dehydroquinate dehydratase-1
LHLRICVPIMERTVQKTLTALNQLEKQDPDLLEIRFDLLNDTSSIAKIRKATDRSIIATNRRRGEGGFFSGREEIRLQSLVQAAQTGFDYVDVELNTKNVNEFIGHLKNNGAKTIISHHDHKTTPDLSALQSILKRGKNAGADICKIVTTAKSYEDNLRCLFFLNKHAKKTKLVCFAMGRLGIPSRILSPMYGAHFTFASYGLGRETAAGQIPMSSLRTFYEEFGIS